MLVESIEVDGVEVFVLDKTDTRLQRFLNWDFSMVDYLMSERNEAVKRGMCEDAEADPCLPKREIPIPRTRKERSVSLETPGNEWITIEVHGVVVRILAVANTRASLTLELTTSMFDVLNMTPPANHVTFPVIENEHIHWYSSRSQVWCNYYDSDTATWLRKFMSVKDAATREELQKHVDQIAPVLAEWGKQHHSEPGS